MGIILNNSGLIINNGSLTINAAQYSASYNNNSYPVNYKSGSTSIGAETTITTYANANADQNNYISAGDNIAIGQSFRSGGEALSRVTFYGRAVGSPTGNTTANLYAHTGTFGTTGLPSGSILATSDIISAASISTTAGPVTYTFSAGNQYQMTSGSVYVIAWSYSGGSTTNHIACEVDISAPTAAGRCYYLKGSTWFTTTQDPAGTSGATDDMTFILYGYPITTTPITASLIDTYAVSNRDSNVAIGAGGIYKGFAQSFTGNGKKLISASVSLLKTGTPTGNLLLKIYRHSGTYGTNSLPLPIPLAVSDTFNVATLTGTNVVYGISFTGPNAILLNNTDKYCLAVEYEAGSAGNTISVGVDASSPTHSGNGSYLGTGSVDWTTSSSDMCFSIYGV